MLKFLILINYLPKHFMSLSLCYIYRQAEVLVFCSADYDRCDDFLTAPANQ
jgi:hypothetical protein